MKSIRKIIKEAIKNVFEESVDMVVSDHHYENELEHILDICHYIIKMVANDLYDKLSLSDEEKEAIGGIGDTFTPDGRDAFEETGIINFYVKGWPAHALEKTISYIKYILGEKNIQVGSVKYEKVKDKIKPEDFKNWGIEDGGETLRVIRIPIIKNESAGNSGNPPSVNFSNNNARVFFHDVLGFDYDEGTSMNTSDLLMKLDSARKQMAVRKDIPDHTYNTQNGNLHGSVNGKDYYEKIFDIVGNFARWASKHGYNRITVG